jgi:hypothetical protein
MAEKPILRVSPLVSKYPPCGRPQNCIPPVTADLGHHWTIGFLGQRMCTANNIHSNRFGKPNHQMNCDKILCDQQFYDQRWDSRGTTDKQKISIPPLRF